MPFIDEQIKSEVSCALWFVSVDITDVYHSSATTTCKTYPGHLPPSSRWMTRLSTPSIVYQCYILSRSRTVIQVDVTSTGHYG
jgi:hypothetical protein